MSDENGYDEDEYYDPYAAQGGSAGAPVISWNYSRPGDKFVGVVVPPEPVKRPDKGYKMVGEYQQGTDTDPDDKGWMVWRPKNDLKGSKRPVTEQKFAEMWPDLPIPKGAGRVSRTSITMATTYSGGEFVSDNAKLRLQDDEVELSGVTERRVILSSQNLREAANKELRRIRATDGAPQVGQTWTVTLVDRVPNVGKPGKTSHYEVHIDPPTDETRAQVQAYVDNARAEAGDAEDRQDGADPYKGPEAVKADAEQKPPPF